MRWPSVLSLMIVAGCASGWADLGGEAEDPPFEGSDSTADSGVSTAGAGPRGDGSGSVGAEGDGGADQRIGTSTSCSTGGWCWSHPLPQGNTLFGGSGRWAVGDNGTILHFNGVGWSSVPSGTTILHWDGELVALVCSRWRVGRLGQRSRRRVGRRPIHVPLERDRVVARAYGRRMRRRDMGKCLRRHLGGVRLQERPALGWKGVVPVGNRHGELAFWRVGDWLGRRLAGRGPRDHSPPLMRIEC
jgi:hypothetical protein